MGLQATLSKVRQKWWITKERATVKKYLNRCIICKKYQTKPYPLSTMPPLSIFKGKECRPFKITGLDYFGPVLVKREEDEKGIMKR